MAASLIARQVTVVRGPVVVLESVDLVLAPGHRVGLIGPNGVGKSTLLGALGATVTLDKGSVEVSPRTANVGLLPQEPERSTTESVRDFLGRRTGTTAAQTELDRATDALAAGDVGADDRYSDALDRWLALGAPDFDARVGETWPNSASTRSCSINRPPRSRGARRRVARSRRCCCLAMTCSCSTSRPMTWTSTDSSGWSGGSSASMHL